MVFVSAGDVIKYALQQEEAALSFYETAANAIKDAEIKKILRTLAEEELKHKKDLSDYELGKNSSFDSLKYTINQSKEHPKEISYSLSFSKLEILDYAINTEKESEFFYSSLAKATEKNKDLRKLFLTLAAMENEHIEKLTTLYNHPFFKT